jgi:hypothetical protein
LLGREVAEEDADLSADGIGASLGGPTEQGFRFGEDLLDGVEVGMYLGAGRAGAGGADGLSFVAAVIVEDDDVAGFEGWHEHLFDAGTKALAVDWPVNDAGRFDAVPRKAARKVMSWRLLWCKEKIGDAGRSAAIMSPAYPLFKGAVHT